MKTHFVMVLTFLSGIFLLSLACGHREPPAPTNQEDYVGNWKVQNPDLGTYFMKLNPDGSGSSTRSGGELGHWQKKADHIELEWTPKNLTLYFDPGSSAPQNKPSTTTEENSIAEKVESQ